MSVHTSTRGGGGTTIQLTGGQGGGVGIPPPSRSDPRMGVGAGTPTPTLPPPPPPVLGSDLDGGRGTCPPPNPGIRPGWWGGGTPHWNSIACTCYAAGGMPLAFTQEDFLVHILFYLIYFHPPPNNFIFLSQDHYCDSFFNTDLSDYSQFVASLESTRAEEALAFFCCEICILL